LDPMEVAAVEGLTMSQLLAVETEEPR
jgi:hypothetical protein